MKELCSENAKDIPQAAARLVFEPAFEEVLDSILAGQSPLVQGK